MFFRRTHIMTNNTHFISLSPDAILSRLYDSVRAVSTNIACYCSDPVSDFTRSRKLPADILMKFLIQKQIRSCRSELCDFFLDSDHLPSSSALSQQRDKLDPFAFKRVLDIFTSSFDNYKTFKGYHILAQDGSDVNIPFLPDDETTCYLKNGRDYCQYHINGLYDCINNVFFDCNIDIPGKTREVRALMDIIKDKNYPLHSIIICDRGYESYNLIACCIENNQKFIVRIKDTNSKNGILNNIALPDGTFDVHINKILTRKQTKDIKHNKEKYTFIPSTSKFDYLDIADDFYEMDLRIVRFEIEEGRYECLVTNLSEEEFDLEELKYLYHMRWSEETGFRTLKYTIGMIQFHSIKRKFIKQEIYASLIMSNLCSIIANNVVLDKKNDAKYDVKTNFAVAVTNIRIFIRKLIDENELIIRIKKFLVPIRPERKFKRNMKPQSSKSLNHRAA